MWKSKLELKYIKGTKSPKMFLLKKHLMWDYIEVPKDFKTDAASIPKFFQFIWKPQGKYTKASIVHDFMYSVNWYSKEFADKTYLEIMLYDKVNPFTAYVFYNAVKLFGGSRYGTK